MTQDMTQPVRVLVWNEHRHERKNPKVDELYPDGIHGAVASALREGGCDVRTATLDDDEHGLTEEALAWAQVVVWWGHLAHEEVKDEIVDRVVKRVYDGMGFVPLHSAHMAKPFRRLMGTGCMLKWREANDKERLWIVAPHHPIVTGLHEFVEIEREEMYGEFFDVPAPEELVFVSWFSGGEVFRSGCTWTRGKGKIFYFRPGHETYPTYHLPDVRRVLVNAAKWAAPSGVERFVQGNAKPLESI
ncbi:ThuA domain-containing protein [Deinococcus yavapaiensis]|uniref:Trehalose utilization protein n=1 Tax=Deinococcus yavapaiensis KR-236 TaxID=694435 RepID=A0A318SFW8_9DEIO|nr:ThuA domain-containing protein [Deinococcus yavapaiensis]PYE56657.1 trehalose utilization protein [Deinococcus yavapaiensis KR-236]